MSIERIFKLCAGLGENFVEIQIRTRDCGDADHKWTVKIARPGAGGSAPVVEASGVTPEGTLAEVGRLLAIRLERQCVEAEERSRELRAALCVADQTGSAASEVK